MNRLEEIKERVKKHRETEHDKPISNHYQFASEVEYLLQRLERYEESLNKCIELGECQLDYGGAIDCLEKIVALAEEALKE